MVRGEEEEEEGAEGQTPNPENDSIAAMDETQMTAMTMRIKRGRRREEEE